MDDAAGVHGADEPAEPLEDPVGELAGLELVDRLPFDVFEEEGPLLDDRVGLSGCPGCPPDGGGRRTRA
jgi:hypothetical protein